MLLGSLLLFALVLNREGDRLPTANEFVYLLYFYRTWHPTFLRTDWTLQEGTAGHAVFNYALGWTTLFLPLKTAAWIGRVGCWTATFVGLFRLGRYFRIAPWAVWAGIVLWLLQRQSLVTGEWMVGSFEAKTIAYPCLLFAIDSALSGRNLLAGVLCGIAFSFHSAVGMWAGAALGFSVLVQNHFRETFKFAAATIVFALPGLIVSLPLITGKNAISPQMAKYLITIALPDCFDPAGFPHTWTALLLGLPIFSWLHARWLSGSKQIHQLLMFEIALVIFFASGVLARSMGWYGWVMLFPMRVYAVFALLFFFWQGMSIITALIDRKPVPRSLCVWAVLLFLCLPSPILQLREMIGKRLVKYLHPQGPVEPSPRGEHADFIQAARWISEREHVPATDVVIAPPWWNDSFYYLNRPLVANWHVPRFNALEEWKQRIEALVGDTSHLTLKDAFGGEMDTAAWSHYATLSTEQISQFEKRYGAKWLLSTGHYSYRIAFKAGSYSVYQLPPVKETQLP